MKIAQLKSIILFILILSLSVSSFAQNSAPSSDFQNQPKGIQLSEEIFDYLTINLSDILSEELKLERQDLLPSDSTSFPQNLIITVSAENSINSSKNWFDSSVDTIVFDFPQGYAYNFLDRIVSFVREINSSKFSFTSVVLLSANDDFPAIKDFESDNKKHPNGTQSYAKKLGFDEKFGAIVISQSNGEATLTPGSGKNVAPLWLVRTINEKIIEMGGQTSLDSFFSLHYLLGLGPDDSRISAFMDMGIPAAGIELNGDKNDFSMLLAIASELSNLHRDNWDRNYLYFTFGKKSFWVPEAVSITLLLLVAMTALLFVCFTGILTTDKSKAFLKDISRTWFFYPLIIAIVTLILHGTQSVFQNLADKNPLLLISLKMFAAFVAILFLFIIQTSLNFKVSLRAQGFLMVAAATVNIFVYSGVNLILMYFFVLEFIIIYISEKVKTTPSLIVSFFATTYPFLLMVASVVKNTVGSKVPDFVTFSWIQDMLFAMLLFPSMMQIERILISTDLFSPNKIMRIRRYIITTICAEIVLIAIQFFTYRYATALMNNSEMINSKPSKFKIIDRDFPLISANLEEQEFMELSMRTLSLNSKDQIMRYEISIETEKGVPIFESNYDYILESSNKISFIIPDFPSGDLKIVYSADSNQVSTITVQAYILQEDSQGLINRDTIVLNTGNRGI